LISTTTGISLFLKFQIPNKFEISSKLQTKMTDEHCPSTLHKYFLSEGLSMLCCEKCGKCLNIASQKPKPSQHLKNIVFSLENMGAKQIEGNSNVNTCLRGDDSNTHYSYAKYPSYLKFELLEPQIVNDCSGQLYNHDGRKSSMLFEASFDDKDWKILHQTCERTINGKFNISFEAEKYKYFRFSGFSDKDPVHFVLNSLYIQYKE
jgi:hypothetical protein